MAMRALASGANPLPSKGEGVNGVCGVIPQLFPLPWRERAGVRGDASEDAVARRRGCGPVGARFIAPCVEREPFSCTGPFGVRRGSAEGRSPFAGGTGVSPVFGFITPFLARKGDGGMVETVVGRRRFREGRRF